MKRLGKLRFSFRMAADAELLLVRFQHRDRRILPGCGADQPDRIDFSQFHLRAVSRMTFRTADIVAPMLAAPEIVMFFFPGVTRQTCFGNFLRVFVFE